MKEGDFVKVEYVGRVTGTNEVFDVTSEEIARKEWDVDMDDAASVCPLAFDKGKEILDMQPVEIGRKSLFVPGSCVEHPPPACHGVDVGRIDA